MENSEIPIAQNLSDEELAAAYNFPEHWRESKKWKGKMFLLKNFNSAKRKLHAAGSGKTGVFNRPG